MPLSLRDMMAAQARHATGSTECIIALPNPSSGGEEVWRGTSSTQDYAATEKGARKVIFKFDRDGAMTRRLVLPGPEASASR
jgi:hypothetical protein